MSEFDDDMADERRPRRPRWCRDEDGQPQVDEEGEIEYNDEEVDGGCLAHPNIAPPVSPSRRNVRKGSGGMKYLYLIFMIILLSGCFKEMSRKEVVDACRFCETNGFIPVLKRVIDAGYIYGVECYPTNGRW